MNIRFLHIIALIIAIIGCSLSSCTDDHDQFRQGGDGKEQLTLKVPVLPGFSSRADGQNAAELEYSSLFFFAFSNAEDVAPVILDLTTDNSPLDFKDIYRSYPLNLAAGDYRFYLVANVWNAGTPVADLPQSEEEINQLNYTFSDHACSIPSSGLPMSAPHGDFSFKDNAGIRSSMSSEWFHYDGKGGELYAVLTFMFAKITIIPQDAAGEPVKVSDIVFSDLSGSEPVMFRAGYDYGRIAKAVPAFDEALHDTISFYIPERYIGASADPSSQSSLDLKIGEKAITLPLGAPRVYSDSINSVPEAGDYREIKRGKEYQYTLFTQDKITLTVSDWTPEMVAASLSGPVFLHIEQQQYEVRAGEETPIWFNSNVSDVRVESPKYTTEENLTLDLFNYSVDATQDTIRLSVNPQIPSDEYWRIKQSLEAGENRYNFVHIVAGNIHKRISISPLNLDYYLILNPEVLTIDVKLRIASGEYAGVLPVSIRSNYPQVRVSLSDDWASLPASEFGTGIPPSGYPLKVSALSYDAEGNPVVGTQVTSSAPQTVDINGGRIYYGVSFSGLNSGLEIWKSSRNVRFMVEGIDENGNTVAGSAQYCTINIVPSILNYKIHFRPAANNWSLPHIYVYQCLEFPADYDQSFNGTPLASKPIGYYPNDSKNTTEAALEYSFSGALGFRGWEYPVNYSLLYNQNGTTHAVSGVMDQGFFIFDNENQSWNFRDYPQQAEARYNTTMDFCREHRDYVTVPHGSEPYCPYCAWLYDSDGMKMNRLWPGIMMRPEEDGWFEFELTGIAEPGRTLIMFADTHQGSTSLRFPGDHAVGMPLFDYPSHEGWFLYNGNVNDRVNNQFLPQKPTTVKK